MLLMVTRMVGCSDVNGAGRWIFRVMSCCFLWTESAWTQAGQELRMLVGRPRMVLHGKTLELEKLVRLKAQSQHVYALGNTAPQLQIQGQGPHPLGCFCNPRLWALSASPLLLPPLPVTEFPSYKEWDVYKKKR